MKKLLFQWNKIKATFWFIPVVTILVAVLLSIVLVKIDGFVDISQDSFGRFFLVNSTDSARSILTTISGAMIGVAGTVFSVTLVALTLASSQFGPRLIKNFMYVRLNQIVLGSYVSTYLYCLLVLNALKDSEGYMFIPSISILAAIIGAIFNIVLLIVFIHQIATSIQADNVISDISDVICEKIEALFPDEMGDEKDKEPNVDVDTEMAKFSKQIAILSPRNGYLQYIDNEVLMEEVVAHDALFDLYHRPGSFLVKEMEIGKLAFNEKLEESELEKLQRQFVIGKTKTSQQDLEFSIHQMVEIAARALSPGVNDPFTAITCIDNLTAALTGLAKLKFPSKYRYDEEGKLRIIANTVDFEGALDAAFNQIRQFSGGSPSVIIRLMEGLITIHGFTTNTKDRDSVIEHAEMVLRMGEETIFEKNDLKDLIERSKQILI
jgi:uncharacterized membrane protein